MQRISNNLVLRILVATVVVTQAVCKNNNQTVPSDSTIRLYHQTGLGKRRLDIQTQERSSVVSTTRLQIVFVEIV